MQPLVLKIGGAFMDDAQLAAPFMQKLAAIRAQRAVVLVHGGGNAVNDLLAKLAIATHKIDGVRVTPKDDLAYIVGVLAGTTNKQLVALAAANQLNAVGLSLADGNMSTCVRPDPAYGAVGVPTEYDAGLLTTLLAAGYTPIISSIGIDGEQQLVNVNGDQAGTIVAQMLNAELALLSDVAGVLDEHKQLIKHLSASHCQQLITRQVIRDGMVNKVQAAQAAADELAQTVQIASWHDVIAQPVDAFLSGAGLSFGTAIAPTVNG